MSNTTNTYNPDENVCSICLGSLKQPGKDLYTTVCQHHFHFVCLTKHIQANHNECPLCRTRLQSLINVIETPTKISATTIKTSAENSATPIKTPTEESPSSSSLWNTLRKSVTNTFTWVSERSTRSAFRMKRQTTSAEDEVDEAVVREISKRIQAARRATVNSATQPERIVATTTLEFGAQASKQQSNIFGMVTLNAPSLLPISASEKELNELRVPVDLVCVIDQSGSMHGEKIHLLKQTLDYIVDQMNHLDRLAIVAFNTSSYNLSNGLIKMVPEKREMFHHTIVENIKAEGGTYIGSGLKMGIDIFRNRRTRNPLGALLLLTDGEDNQYHDYTNLMETLPGGVVCHTFGYGLGHKAALLSQLAEQGHGGTFTFIDTMDSISIAFATALGSLFTCIAQNININLKFNHQYAITHCHTLYNYEPKQLPSRNVTFKLQDLNSEEKRNLLFQLNVPQLDEPVTDNHVIGTVSIKYTDAISGRQMNTEAVPFVLERQAEISNDSPLLQVNYTLDVQRNRADTSRVLKQAVNEPNYERVRELLNSQIAKIRASVSVQDPLCQQLIKDLEYQYSNHQQFISTMTNMYMQHGQERFVHAAMTTTSANCYMTSGQERFRSLVHKK